MKPPPPIPEDCGSTTLSAKATAAAASTALPPSRRILAPTSAAIGSLVATTPPCTPGTPSFRSLSPAQADVAARPVVRPTITSMPSHNLAWQ
ncbi:MAG: hypothetical protein V3V40_00090 [Nitrosomonadaceae bacterium]